MHRSALIRAAITSELAYSRTLRANPPHSRAAESGAVRRGTLTSYSAAAAAAGPHGHPTDDGDDGTTVGGWTQHGTLISRCVCERFSRMHTLMHRQLGTVLTLLATQTCAAVRRTRLATPRPVRGGQTGTGQGTENECPWGMRQWYSPQRERYRGGICAA